MAPFATIYTWGPGNPRVARAAAIANLNGLELSIPTFNLGTDRTPEWYSKFPYGKVPALETPSGVYLTETQAIAQFLAASGPLSAQLLGSTPAESAMIQQWVAHADGEFWPPILPLFLVTLGMRAHDAGVEAESKKTLGRVFDYLETVLKADGRKWVAGTKEVSLADVSLASVVMSAFKSVFGKEEREKYPKAVEWFERVTDLEAVKKAFGERVYKE